MSNSSPTTPRPASKFDQFEKYARRQSIARFMARYELFKLQMHIKGCIVECGVHHGGGVMAWAKLSAALEPYSLDRRIFGFDTFEGFPSISEQDATASGNDQLRIGGFNTEIDTHAELLQLIREYDENRVLNQFEKVVLIKGDAVQTIPKFIADEPSVLVSLLFLDFDLYMPTKVALQTFLPRMSRGSILAFDEINNRWWPGETQAMLECLDLRQHEIRRFSFDPNIAYIVL
jgi:hypothetical protein